MSIATGLIAKLLLAVSVIPTAGYGGYCVYDSCNPTFHSLMEKEGWMWSPINGDLGAEKVYYKRRKEIFKNLGGDWRCSKQLFEDNISPTTDINSDKVEGVMDVPSSSSSENASEDYEGCLVADLGYSGDTSKKAGFLKWELALRSKDKGFIYTGFFSIGNIKDADGTTKEKIPQQSYSMVFEVKKDESKWDIKSGLSWVDYFTSISSTDSSTSTSSLSSFDNIEIKILLPNDQGWNSSGKICSLSAEAGGELCPQENGWIFQKYVGFWEKSGEEGKQAIDAIKIVATETDKKEHKHDIWSNENFDFSASAQNFSSKPVWGGSLDFVYDAQNNKWKKLKGTSPDATQYLKTIYSPWAKKKGKWTEADKICYQSNSRSGLEEGEAKRLLKFCYKK